MKVAPGLLAGQRKVEHRATGPWQRYLTQLPALWTLDPQAGFASIPLDNSLTVRTAETQRCRADRRSLRQNCPEFPLQEELPGIERFFGSPASEHRDLQSLTAAIADGLTTGLVVRALQACSTLRAVEGNHGAGLPGQRDGMGQVTSRGHVHTGTAFLAAAAVHFPTFGSSQGLAVIGTGPHFIPLAQVNKGALVISNSRRRGLDDPGKVGQCGVVLFESRVSTTADVASL